MVRRVQIKNESVTILLLAGQSGVRSGATTDGHDTESRQVFRKTVDSFLKVRTAKQRNWKVDALISH